VCADRISSGFQGRPSARFALGAVDRPADDQVHRRKQGFGIPLGEWFRLELRPWLEGVLRDPSGRARGYFEHAEIDRLLSEHMSGYADHTPRLWSLAMLELWHRRWIDAAS